MPLPRVFVAEGHLVPNKDMTLVFSVRGKVDKILVTKGEKVKAGQDLIRLADQEQAIASLAAARLGQLSARQDQEELLRTTDLVHGQAWQTYINAQAAHAAVEQAWEALDLNAIADLILNAQEVVDARKADLNEAQKEFDKYKSLDPSNPTRKTAEDNLSTAQNNYNKALRKLEEVSNQRDSVKAALLTTQAAEMEARRKFENTQNGADPDVLSLMEARLKSADAQVAAAQLLVDGYVLKAPFDSIVTDINLSKGQMAGPETWAVIVADLSNWYVDTSDMSELDVVNVEVGEQVEVSVDALPGLTLNGIVEEISMTPKNQAGDILYTVHIRIEDASETRLRWGMTVAVTFPEK
jgi:multidrug resistance efflux pump